MNPKRIRELRQLREWKVKEQDRPAGPGQREAGSIRILRAIGPIGGNGRGIEFGKLPAHQGAFGPKRLFAGELGAINAPRYGFTVILSLAGAETERVFRAELSRRLPRDIQRNR